MFKGRKKGRGLQVLIWLQTVTVKVTVVYQAVGVVVVVIVGVIVRVMRLIGVEIMVRRR